MLYHIDQIPSHFHELYIQWGYRHPRSSFSECLLSLFQLHNETINIWTHLLPAVYYLWIFCRDTIDLHLMEDSYGFPMLVYLISVSLFPMASCIAHIFNTMSEKARHICFFIDYWALSTFSMGCAIAYKSYSFPLSLTKSQLPNIYVAVATVNALVSYTLVCRTRFLDHGIRKKIFRIASFAVPYLYDVIPVTYRALVGDEVEWQYGGLYYHMRQFLFAFLSAFLYSSHLPERVFPGKFDLIGHSHQIFHVVSVLGTHDQLVGMRADMVERRQILMEHGLPTPGFSSTILLMFIVAFINSLVFLHYCSKLDHIILKSTSSDDLTKLNNLCNGYVNGHSASPANGKSGKPSFEISPANGIVLFPNKPRPFQRPHKD